MQGLQFYIDLDGVGSSNKDGMLPLLRRHILAEGGASAVSLQECSHAVLRHKQQAAYTAALDMGCSIVTAEWVLLSAVRQELQPKDDDNLLPGPAIPGFAGHVRQVTLSAITKHVTMVSTVQQCAANATAQTPHGHQSNVAGGFQHSALCDHAGHGPRHNALQSGVLRRRLLCRHASVQHQPRHHHQRGMQGAVQED
ncbi:hypothetical protein COO60DRAFT_1029601 [Scenedesmus sp. NREL 46B-D3]|nr:hypothetical protein COO60DRAFT_1029601 [Scenedesmus sp. NREL 46B-D3]